MRSLRAAGVVAFLVAGLLAGCSSIPDGGPVRTAAPQQQGDQDERAAFVPNGPTDGMSPKDVVSGFVIAQSAGGDYTVAKEFLTDGFARSWRPNEAVSVYGSQWSVDGGDGADAAVRLRVPRIAEVGPTGRYTPTTTPTTKDYSLQRVRGQWRISAGDPGIVLSSRAFQTVFTPIKLQFFDPGYRRLIPDLRWFPRGDSTAETAPAVVRAALDGPAPVLQGVTEPVFPAGTELAAPVRSSDGVTTVSIRVSGPALTAEATDRVQQALAGALGISTAVVRLVVDGVQAPIAPSPDLQQPSISGAVVVAGDRFGTVTAQGTVQEDRDLGPAIVKLRPTAVTVSAGQRLAALLTRGGQVWVVARQQRSRMVDDRSGLIAPTLDQQGWTYSVPGDDPTGLRAANADGDPAVTVDAELPAETLSIEASTDGTRMLVLGRSSTGFEAYVAAILRDADGTPTGLSTEHYAVALSSADAAGATWVDQANVAVLTTTSSVQSVTLQQLGGLSTTLGTLSNAQRIVGGTTQLDLRALVGPGQILQLSTTNGWVREFPATLDADVLAVQR